MKIFLDDVRVPAHCLDYMKPRIGKLVDIYKEDWVIVRNFEEFQGAILEAHANGVDVTDISFDHDLADEHYYNDTKPDDYKEKTGEDCAKWFREYYDMHELDYPKCYVHSMNPVGAQNIVNALKAP